MPRSESPSHFTQTARRVPTQCCRVMPSRESLLTPSIERPQMSCDQQNRFHDHSIVSVGIDDSDEISFSFDLILSLGQHFRYNRVCPPTKQASFPYKP
jgi:hypothetical protein